MIRFRNILLFVPLILAPFFAQGATSQFTISTLIGSDTTPPSTPTLVSAVPVSTSQIDIVWTAATDNFALGGYQVFRNSIQIATTSLTTYTDSPLTQNTLYTYTVRAFDSVFNYGSTSNALATSTLRPVSTSTPPTSTGGSSTQSSGSPLSVTSFRITPSLQNALFEWEASSYAKFELRWGRTISYELGFVSHDALARGHRTLIPDLEPGTVYEFELVGYNKWGKQYTLKRGQFATLSLPDTKASPNVSNLKAYVVGDNVHLSWINPKEEDFSKVRVVRSHLFFPTSAQDGFLSYEQNGTSFTDRGALHDVHIQYYTVFTVDREGNMSSGAVIAVVRDKGTIPKIEVDKNSLATHTLLFEDFEFLQNEKKIDEKGVSDQDSFIVRILYEKLPLHLKTITMTLGIVPEDATYLLRINKEKTYYEAYLPRQVYEGQVPVVFSVYDFKTKTMERVEGVIPFYTKGSTDTKTLLTPLLTTLAIESEVITFLFFFLVFVLLISLMMILRKFRD